MHRRTWFVLVPKVVGLWIGITVAVTAGAVLTAHSQEASPAVNADVPDPTECLIEPRSPESLRSLFREAMAATPARTTAEVAPPARTPPAGQPADAPTVAALNATWREFLACVNGDDHLRQFAFMSDAKIRADFAVDVANGATEEQVIAFVSATPVPIVASERFPFVPVRDTDTRVLTDGRVAVVGPDEVLVFANEENRWLVDDQFALATEAPSGSPTSESG
jgi:hypothetical protein